MYSNIKVQGIYIFFSWGGGWGGKNLKISKLFFLLLYYSVVWGQRMSKLVGSKKGMWVQGSLDQQRTLIWTRFKIKWQIDMRIESPLKSQASCPHEDQMMILFTRGHPVYPLICFTTHKTRPCVIVTGTQGYHYSAIINAYFVTDLIQTKSLGHCVVNILTILTILWVFIWLMN